MAAEDKGVPNSISQRHKEWREELPVLASVHLSRCYFSQEKPLTVELHGFCDASQEAYAAVIYLRATYASKPPSCKLVISKTRVAPLKPMTIPRLELCGAALLAKIMKATRETLGIPIEQVHAWSDSTIVLAWLDGSPQRYRIYVANRLVAITGVILQHGGMFLHWIIQRIVPPGE